MDRLSFRLIVPFVVLFALAAPLPTSCQTTEPDQVPAAGVPSNPPPAAPQPKAAVERPVSWKLLVPNVLSDQEHIWLFPAKLAKGHDWIPTLAILGTGASLVALDPIEGKYFRNTSSFSGFNNAFSSNNTIYGTIAAPAALYVAGLLRKDSKMTRTALFAGEAAADAEVVTTFLKDTTRRLHPSSVPAHGNYWDTWFDSGGSPLSARGGFPSGHTIVAFSIATVVARRYGNHRWVPYVAYGAAALVGFSRLTLSAHFTSDVFIGAALGYSIGRFGVLRQ
ncbi:MAG TPA: phosphatase PAP2 family protein [Bryobacteraceae bacterium]|nr:phosphatase PAP2 family protein [Bryobacteraceae bacterium]